MMQTAIEVARPSAIATQSHKFSVDVFAGRDLLRTGWPSINDRSDLRMYVYQSREFLDIWMNTIGEANRAQPFLIVISHRQRGPVLYLPLVIERKFNVRLLRFMDAGVADFNAPIVAPGVEFSREEFAGIWKEILARLPKIDAVLLQKISANIADAVNPLMRLDCAPHGSSGHIIQLSAARDDINVRPSVLRLRKKLRRDFRRLTRTGDVNFVVNPAPSEAEEIFTSLSKFKSQKYLASMGSDFLAMRGIRRFFREMAAPQRVGAISHVSALTCNNEVVSAHLGFMARGCFYYSFPAYNVAYRQYSVGHLLLQHLIDQSVAQGLETFSLGEGDFPYKARWVTRRIPLHDHEQAVTGTGLLYLQLRRTRRDAQDRNRRSDSA